MRESIFVCVIGIGYGQQVQVPAFRSGPRCRVVAICASTMERAARFAGKLEIPRAFGDWREVVADPGTDAVAIVVPPALQVLIVLAAASARKHVFCEKPVALSAAQAREMFRAVEEARVASAV